MVGLDDVLSNLVDIRDKVASAEALSVGLMVGGNKIVEQTKANLTANGSVKSGALRDSYHAEHGESGPDYAEILVGSSGVPYAWRVEFGFSGADSLGRVYNQAAKPAFRPAIDEHQAEIVSAVVDTAREQVAEALISQVGEQASRRRGALR